MAKVATTPDELRQLAIDLIKVIVYENNLTLHKDLLNEIYATITNYELLAPVEFVNHFAACFQRDPMNINAWLLNCHNLNEVDCIVYSYLYPLHQRLQA